MITVRLIALCGLVIAVAPVAHAADVAKGHKLAERLQPMPWGCHHA
jgi:hypothetical protein